MFTNSFIALQKALFTMKNGTFTLPDGGTSTLYPRYQDAYYASLGNAMQTATLAASDVFGVQFGTGPTPATANDYKLESPITSGLSITNTGILVGKEAEGKYAAVASYGVSNTSSTPIQIYELGIYLKGAYNSSSSTATKSFLAERTVLTEPIGLQPGEEKIITYKITFNQTLNVADAYEPEA